MSLAALLLPVAQVVVRLGEQAPDDEDVTAGWTAAVVFVLLILAVAFLGFSLSKQLRRAEAAKRSGVYGDDPEGAVGTDGTEGAPDGPGRTDPGRPASP